MIDALLAAFLGLACGGGVCYAVMRARDACEVAESAEHAAEEAAEALAVQALRQAALDKRLHVCERAVDELCLRTNFGVRRKGDNANPG